MTDRKTREVTITRKINPGPYRSVDEIIEANRDAGFYFFAPETLRSFGSRIGQVVYGGRYFTTSERSGFDFNAPRAYSVRIAMPDGSIETVGYFGQFTSAAQASRMAQRVSQSPTAVRHDPYDPDTDATPDTERYEWRAWTTSPTLPIGTRDTRGGAEVTASILNTEREDRTR